jgi:DNA-binding transcriptional LysR family regulator
MDIRYLEYILALAETGNMTKAAKKLYVSQPTLSQFLTKQEQELGTPLFQRSNGTYTLTSVGSLYAEYAKKVISLTDNLEKDIKRVSNSSRIRIGTSASSAMQMLSCILADFRQYYPKVELVLSDDNLSSMSNFISRGEIDLAFVTANSLEQYKGQSIELKKEEVVFAAPSLHPYCQKVNGNRHRPLTSAQLLEHFHSSPFILQHKGSCIRYLIEDFFDKQDFNPTIACMTSQVQSICDMISSNIGVGFLPVGYQIPNKLITSFSLEPKLYRIHSILYRKDLIMTPPHKCLIELAQAYVKTN